MHCSFRDGERWNSSTIVVYPGPITPSLSVIRLRHSHREPMTCKRPNQTGFRPRHRRGSWEKTAFGPSQIPGPGSHDNSWFSGGTFQTLTGFVGKCLCELDCVCVCLLQICGLTHRHTHTQTHTRCTTYTRLKGLSAYRAYTMLV